MDLTGSHYILGCWEGRAGPYKLWSYNPSTLSCCLPATPIRPSQYIAVQAIVI